MTNSHWLSLKEFTAARIALGRAGSSLPTQAMLDFQLDHARARDAVYGSADWGDIARRLRAVGESAGDEVAAGVVLRLKSQAADRQIYLKRPDLGRRLASESADLLAKAAWNRRAAGLTPTDSPDLVFVIADGLSARAVQTHAVPFVRRALGLAARRGWTVGPVCLVEQGRVAIGDPIGEALRARMSVTLIGERPGLSSPDSMGLYITYEPRAGTTDERRNCISNIRPEGLPVESALQKFDYLVSQALLRGLTGVTLKDEWDPRREKLVG